MNSKTFSSQLRFAFPLLSRKTNTYKQFDFGAIEKWNATPDGMLSITDERTVRIELK